MYDILVETKDGQFITWDQAHTEQQAQTKVRALQAKKRNAKYQDRDMKRVQREERRPRRKEEDDFNFDE